MDNNIDDIVAIRKPSDAYAVRLDGKIMAVVQCEDANRIENFQQTCAQWRICKRITQLRMIDGQYVELSTDDFERLYFPVRRDLF